MAHVFKSLCSNALWAIFDNAACSVTLLVVNTKSVIICKSQKVTSEFKMRQILFEKAFMTLEMMSLSNTDM